MTDLEKLMQQILSQWGNSGDWGMAGVNRAEELAKLLQQSGVTDLNGLKLEKAQETYTPTLNDWGEMNIDPNYTKTREGYQLTAGDKKLGYLGNVGDGKDSAKSFLEQVDGKPGETTYRLGGSAAGDGWTSFDVTPGADGQFSIAPKWGSSSNADEFLKAATAIAAPVAAWGAGLGMPALAEAAVPSAADVGLMADLGGKTLTPSMWSTAFPELAATGGLTTMAGLPAVPDALAPLAAVPPMEALPALAATPAVPSLASAGLGAGALGAASGAGLLKLGTAALGAMAGSQKSGDTTATNTRSLDPRIDQRVFGSGGLLELADKQLSANPTGQNDTMRSGQTMLRNLLLNPGVAQGLGSMAGQGQSMMNAGIASNPFMNWKFPGV